MAQQDANVTGKELIEEVAERTYQDVGRCRDVVYKRMQEAETDAERKAWKSAQAALNEAEEISRKEREGD